MDNILEINKLKKQYRDNLVLNGIDLHIKRGAIYGLIGKNGVGKTTIIRIICGLQEPTNGKYLINNIDFNNTAILNERKKMGAIIETPSVYKNLTAKENLILQYNLIGKKNYDNIENLLKLVGLENTCNTKVENFSLGMKQRLGIAITLVSDPELLILDEPINGLDPKGIIEMRELILKLNKKGITFLISSHYLDELSKIATHYGFINNGKIIKEINSNELKDLLQKRTEIKLNKINEAELYFKEQNMSYKLENDKIVIFNKVNISKIIIDLAKRNCYVDEIYNKNETLEEYYMNLIGGTDNV